MPRFMGREGQSGPSCVITNRLCGPTVGERVGFFWGMNTDPAPPFLMHVAGSASKRCFCSQLGVPSERSVPAMLVVKVFFFFAKCWD